MLASITPLGERGRRQRWGVTVAFLLAGATLAGAAVGGVLAATGTALPVSSAVRLAVLGAVVAVGLALDLSGRLPTHLRQVDERHLHRFRGWVYGLGFGVQLGTGLATVITTSTVYTMLAAALLAPSVAWGAAIVAAFGAVRGVTPLLSARVDSPRALARFHRRFHALDRRAACAALVSQAALLALLLLLLAA